MLLVGIFMFSRNGLNNGFFKLFNINSVNGQGPVKTELRAISSFKSITMNIAGDVEFSVSDQYSVEVQAQENLLPILKTVVEGENLRISFEQNVRSEENILIKISAPTIEAFDLAGSGNIRVLTPLKNEKLKLDITGSGNIFVTQADVADLYCSVTGSGVVELGGKAQKVTAAVGGSGAINARNLNAEIMEADISGSGDVECTVAQTLKANVSGSGNVRYGGSPQVDSRVSGSGAIEKF